QPRALTAPHQPLPISDDLIRVPIVKDIGAIKNVDPKQARELRLDMRKALSNALDETREIKGISPADEYLIGNT
ncbi:MAG: hypothetical protein ACO24V_01690, partial [Candidatus Nanopelagicales bacterium]